MNRPVIPVAGPVIGNREAEYVLEALRNGQVSSEGDFVARFERGFASYVGVEQATTTSNGTTALHLVTAALGLGQGDEVVVPAMTFVATANAVRYVGATPVFADVDPDTWTLSADSVRPHLTPRTRAVIAVHLFGHPADMDSLRDLCEPRGIALIEDAAQAHGAEYRGQRVGGLARVSTFSFYANKIITTGEGGMVASDDAVLMERVRLLKNHGMDPARRYHHSVLGFNYRMTNLQAALGLAQLEQIEDILRRKREIARRYAEGLSDLPGWRLPREAPWATSVFWMYAVALEEHAEVERNSLCERLLSVGVDTRPLFVPLHHLPMYRDESGASLPVAERLGRCGFYLPSGAGLTGEAVDRVVEACHVAMKEPAAG